MPYIHEVNHVKLTGLQDRRRKLTDEQKAEIIRLRNEGWSLANISKEDAELILLEWIGNYHEIKNLIKEGN